MPLIGDRGKIPRKVDRTSLGVLLGKLKSWDGHTMGKESEGGVKLSHISNKTT